MINNGKDEKVRFNEEVMEKSVNVRTQIAQKKQKHMFQYMMIEQEDY